MTLTEQLISVLPSVNAILEGQHQYMSAALNLLGHEYTPEMVPKVQVNGLPGDDLGWTRYQYQDAFISEPNLEPDGSIRLGMTINPLLLQLSIERSFQHQGFPPQQIDVGIEAAAAQAGKPTADFVTFMASQIARDLSVLATDYALGLNLKPDELTFMTATLNAQNPLSTERQL